MERYIFSDLAWLALDAVGHIAVFTTAGIAPIPSAVLDHPEAAKSVEELLEELAAVGGHRLLVTLPRPEDYVGFARRGLFAYDWRDVHRTAGYSRCYEIIAQPEVCRTLESIGAELRATARLVVFEMLGARRGCAPTRFVLFVILWLAIRARETGMARRRGGGRG